MPERFREIEKKVRISTSSNFYPEARKLERIYADIVSPACTLRCGTQDYYWTSPYVQSVRLRDSRGAFLSGKDHWRRELTVKKQDRGSNVDRLEINVQVGGIQNTKALISMLLGAEPAFVIEKKEVVFFGSNDLVVSLYQVNEGAIYLEAEAPDVSLVDRALGALRSDFFMVPEPRSLFEIYAPAGEKGQ